MSETTVSTATPIVACPGCGDVQNVATDPLGENRPKAGDISICLRCGYLTVFNADLSRREPATEELDSIPFETQQTIGRFERCRREVVKR